MAMQPSQAEARHNAQLTTKSAILPRSAASANCVSTAIEHVSAYPHTSFEIAHAREAHEVVGVSVPVLVRDVSTAHDDDAC